MTTVLATKIYIHPSTFYNCQNITSVNLNNVPFVNNSMRYNYSGAFYNCKKLTTISGLNQNITDMHGAYASSTNLVDIPTIPPNVTDLSYAYQFVSSVNSIPTIPDSVTNVAYGFMSCRNLRTLPAEMPPNIVNYAYAFGECSNLVTAPNINAHLADNLWVLFKQDYNLQSSNIVIGPNALYIYGMYSDCRNLTHLNFTYLDYNNTTRATDVHEMFSGCNKLSTFPELPPVAQNLYQTFYNCQLLTQFNCPQTALNLNYAFFNCQNLQQITIPNSVISMAGAFQNCYKFTEATIPPSVSGSIANAYYNCYNVNTIIGNVPEGVNNVSGLFYNCKNISGDIFIYSSEIDNASQCFYNTTAIKNVYIPFKTTEETTERLYCWIVQDNGDKIYIKEDYSESSGYTSEIYNAEGTRNNNYAQASMEYGNGSALDAIEWIEHSIIYDSNYDVITVIPAGSTTKTYNAFISAGYTTDGSVCGVHLKDLNNL